MDRFREIVKKAIDDRKGPLNDMAKYLYDNPELNFQEFKAHDYITKFLEGEGFAVTRKYILDTAFRAEFGDGTPVVVILCEYDALPKIGHACGHNLIAMCSVATGIAVKAVMEQVKTVRGKVVVLGTPAEEGGHGKVFLIDGGALKGADVAMMAHPTNLNDAYFETNSLDKIFVDYRSSNLNEMNALDAGVGSYLQVSMLRQQMMPQWR
ncbi:unnamed protein product, partial [Ixodes hexagonus]